MNLTTAQHQAVAARGNVLVVAGAGTGKTRTLVERCLSCLLEEEPPASLDEILIVTFTDAAAAEMRKRIRERIEAELAAAQGTGGPRERHLREQLALFDAAHLGTLHSFCLKLVRQHFYELELDPQLAVMPQEEARLLAEETLTELFNRHYSAQTGKSEAVQQLIQVQGGGSDQSIRALILRLHHYSQTRPDAAGWLREQTAQFSSPEPGRWMEWLMSGVREWRDRWLSQLELVEAQNAVARQAVAHVGNLSAKPSRAEAAQALAAISQAVKECPFGKKKAWLDPIKAFVEETEFLLSLAGIEGTAADPLAEDWNWVRMQMGTLLELAREFHERFAEAKRELGVVDFHDLEQFALRLLWDTGANQPTAVARQWRQRLRFVFVDEYQDINAAQDRIIEALSREGLQANRFLVGDVKQSIYRFRLADPGIFLRYVEAWRGSNGQAISLVENFRSREGILKFINSVFGTLLRREMGGVPYDEAARLRFGAPEARAEFGIGADPVPRVELHLRVKGNGETKEEELSEAEEEVADLEAADKEARLVALRLRELKAERYPIWDEAVKGMRAVEWSDMAVLLRSPSGKAESYAKEFARLDVPLLVARGGFYESTEVTDLLSLLQLLDNPLQDLPLLAVLRSPLAGLSLDELATVRLAARGHYWTALVKWDETARCVNGGEPAGPAPLGAEVGETSRVSAALAAKVSAFLDRYGRWRRLVRQESLSRCLDAVLTETHYMEWVLTESRAEQRQANLHRLLRLARQFDQFQRQSLFRFLRFVEAQKQAETEPEVAAVSEENSVRLLSIHQSKGLEFPVVVVADLGKPFNLADLRAEVMLDEEYGVCPQVKPPHGGSCYPSLPYWLARQRQGRELLGEELRLLYVAMTRARELLLLSGQISSAKFKALWSAPRSAAGEATIAEENSGSATEPSPLSLMESLAAHSYSDWLGSWFARQGGQIDPVAGTGANALLRWVVHDDARLLESGATLDSSIAPALSMADAGPELWQELQRRFEWVYPFAAATREPAKTSVTLLRRTALPIEEDAAQSLLSQAGLGESNGQRPPRPAERRAAGAADYGNAHHRFLERVLLDKAGSVAELKAEARRLEGAGALTKAEARLLDFEGLSAFWSSPLGRRIRAQSQFVRRELAFTARFSPGEIAAATGKPAGFGDGDDFVVVQGVADLVVALPTELWLVDFKTDRVAAGDLEKKVNAYAPQVRLYAAALERIYHRPVSQGWLCFLSARRTVEVRGGDFGPAS